MTWPRYINWHRKSSRRSSVAALSTQRLQFAGTTALLAFLLLHRDTPQSRQRLAFLFWPDSNEARTHNNLRQSIHRLRQALPEAGSRPHRPTNARASLTARLASAAYPSAPIWCA